MKYIMIYTYKRSERKNNHVNTHFNKNKQDRKQDVLLVRINGTNFAENEPVGLPGIKLLLVGKRLSKIWHENANRGPARRVGVLSLLGNQFIFSLQLYKVKEVVMAQKEKQALLRRKQTRQVQCVLEHLRKCFSYIKIR